MRRLEFFKCGICNCYWNKNLINITGYRPKNVFSKDKQRIFAKFICEKCSEKLYDLYLSDLRKRFVEEWKYKRLNKAVDKLTKKIKLYADKRETYRIKKKIKMEADKIKSNRQYLRDSLNRKIKNLSRQFRRVRRRLKSV